MYKITFVVLPCLCTGCLLNLFLVVYLAVRSSIALFQYGSDVATLYTQNAGSIVGVIVNLIRVVSAVCYIHRKYVVCTV
jgi:hypothetical protein